MWGELHWNVFRQQQFCSQRFSGEIKIFQGRGSPLTQPQPTLAMLWAHANHSLRTDGPNRLLKMIVCFNNNNFKEY